MIAHHTCMLTLNHHISITAIRWRTEYLFAHSKICEAHLSIDLACKFRASGLVVPLVVKCTRVIEDVVIIVYPCSRGIITCAKTVISTRSWKHLLSLFGVLVFVKSSGARSKRRMTIECTIRKLLRWQRMIGILV